MWTAIQEFAKDPRNIEPSEFNTLKSMLSGSKLEVELASTKLKSMYESSDVYTDLHQQVTGNVVVAGKKMERISRLDYARAMETFQKGGMPKAEFDKIREQRLASADLEARGL
jgi:hypothetical protein